MRVFRLGYLSINALFWISSEERRLGVNEDRVPEGSVYLTVFPGNSYVLSGEEASEFRRQLDDYFPAPKREAPGPRPTIAGEYHDTSGDNPGSSPGGESVQSG